jgi:hypothetical protein
VARSGCQNNTGCAADFSPLTPVLSPLRGEGEENRENVLFALRAEEEREN